MTYPWWSLIPFVLMLAAIAILPISGATHWWEKTSSQLLVALGLAIPTSIWLFLFAGSEPLVSTGIDYIQFICLLLSLFVVSGGIHLAGDIEATPRNNTIFLAVGGLLASFVGTTGAAMLLIRPILATNRERTHRLHTVLFTIFIVANCGGLLTPLGDPPLFLGFLKGVPFTWTFNLWVEWLFVLVLLLLTYYSLDSTYHASEPQRAVIADRTEITPLRLDGKLNLVFFAAIVASVAFIPSVDAHEVAAGHAHGLALVPFREIAMVSIAAASYFLGSKKVRFEDNAFTWTPITEVAVLFIGIFATMAPALRFLEQVAPSLPLNRVTFFIFTGGLSSVLDNAPTYLTFFEMAKVLAQPGQTLVAGVPEHFLVPISLGAVFCGAITYIGNGPNFMVKSVAESDGVEMPSFGRYVVDAFLLLVPVLASMALIFVAEIWWAHIMGWVLAAAIALLAVIRIVRARQLEDNSLARTQL
ncbi:sodium:proton antiporter [Schaalia sp. 19OD2882]|uniref:sodium:proton antiporter n=1 Tax=Schaalia sp. 19OD2882 TaxID=2794089 RepID=UPI001C1E999A|nr:sodium:proton antiporter [Schaalia sp. 19OD2882]QWW20330.1 sodium:proton antiporter [Schaalia sp. 19OD2882]